MKRGFIASGASFLTFINTCSLTSRGLCTRSLSKVSFLAASLFMANSFIADCVIPGLDTTDLIIIEKAACALSSPSLSLPPVLPPEPGPDPPGYRRVFFCNTKPHAVGTPVIGTGQSPKACLRQTTVA